MIYELHYKFTNTIIKIIRDEPNTHKTSNVACPEALDKDFQPGNINVASLAAPNKDLHRVSKNHQNRTSPCIYFPDFILSYLVPSPNRFGLVPFP